MAGREVETQSSTDRWGVRWIKDGEGKRPPYVMMVPLLEIISEAVGSGVGSQRVLAGYEGIINALGSEFKVLLHTPAQEIKRVAGERVSQAISKVRSGDIVIEPGYDGVFGKVKIWKEEGLEKEEKDIDQGTLF